MVIYTYKNIKQGLLKETFLYFKLLSKFFAAPVAYTAYKLGITANQVTITGLLLSIPAAYFNLTDNFILAIAVFHLFFLLDAADGVLARGTNTRSILGAYLDDLAHYTFQPIFLVSFAYASYMNHYTTLSLFVALFALLNTLCRANLDLINKLRYKNGCTSFVSSGKENASSSLAFKIKGFFLRSFDFPNVLVFMTLLFHNKLLLKYYFVYITMCSTLYFIFTVIKTVCSEFNYTSSRAN